MLPSFPQRCEKPCAKAIISHGGPSTVSAATVGPRRSVGPRVAAFRTQLNQALAQEDLGELYRLWDRWTARDLSDVPLDTREANVVRRQAERIARDRLRHALSGEDGSLDEALREADAVVLHWPFAVGVKSSLEYRAALKHQQDRQEPEEQEGRSEMQRRTVRKPWDEEEEEEQSTTAGSEPDEETASEATAEEPREENVADATEDLMTRLRELVELAFQAGELDAAARSALGRSEVAENHSTAAGSEPGEAEEMEEGEGEQDDEEADAEEEVEEQEEDEEESEKGKQLQRSSARELDDVEGF